VAEEDFAAALAHYSRAAELAPDVAELPFWQAVTLFVEGREEEALEVFRRVFAADPRWVRLVPRLPASGLLPDDPAKIERILAEASAEP
jgi:tetratricopeptide (TPR) repeat protein